MAKPGDLILLTSYGSGAGSDSFIIEATDKLAENKNPYPLKKMIEDKEYIDYAIYAKYKSKLKGVALEK